MDWLARLFFPDNPRLVRHRKLQLLFFTIALCVLSCAAVGLLFYLLGQSRY
jgi:hypothetical protein